MIWVISLVSLALFVLGAPFVLVIATWTLAASILIDYSLLNMGVATSQSIKNFVFLAVPLFVATGDYLTEAGISRKLMHFARSLVGFLPGATSATAVLSCGMFSAVSGSNSATAATIGRLVKDEMAERGISNSFAAATVAAGGIVGIIIPPSVIFIVYGVTVNVPSVDLFIGGFLPGVLMTALVLVMASARTRRIEPGVGIRSMSIATISRTAVGAWAGFVAIGMIFGGLYFGLLSPTEAAGVVTIYCMVMAILAWRKERRFSASYFVSILLRSAGITGIIVPLVAFSVIFQEVTSIMGLPEFVQAVVKNIGAQYGTAIAILVMMGIIAAVGAITESVAVVLILGPIFAPVAVALGIDPVHWGVAFVVGTAIGFITPPYGLNLFVVSAVCDAPYSSVVRNILPYIAPLMLLWAFITFSPWTTSVLRTMLQ